MQKIPGYPEEEGVYLDTAEIGKRTRQENRRLIWLAVKQNKVSYLMILPFMLFFLVFTIVPVVMSLPMGFTDFNMVQMPKFVGLSNYTTLFLADKVFIQSIRVTLVFALFTGPISYILCFLLAWLINELHPKLRTIFTLIFYAPSMANRPPGTPRPCVPVETARQRSARSAAV